MRFVCLMTAPKVHPHGRGDGQLRLCRLKVHLRFTPTGVGTADRLGRQPLDPGRFTPTGVGTAYLFMSVIKSRVGSPPRAWGRPLAIPLLPHFVRFTPTGVGTAARVAGFLQFSSVHPHGRGDGGMIPVEYAREIGSPPRAWGRPQQPPHSDSAHKVHPHGRGDGQKSGDVVPSLKSFTPTGVGTAAALNRSGALPHGSPPRAWGRRASGDFFSQTSRFTPTGVGTATISMVES